MHRLGLCSTLLASACALPPVSADKSPLRFEPPSEIEQAVIDSDVEPDDEGRAQDALYTDGAGNTYSLSPDSIGDQTLVVTIESGQGGPLEPTGALGESAREPESPAAEPAPSENDQRVDPERPVVPNDGRPYMVMQWPMPTTGVTSFFGARTDPITKSSRFHFGVDLQGKYGQIIQALAPGRVVFSGWNSGHGRMVIIEHPGGWRSSYSHLSMNIAGNSEYVVTGQVIGQMGNSGRSTGPHLHLEITRWGRYYDPLEVLGRPVPIDWSELKE